MPPFDAKQHRRSVVLRRRTVEGLALPPTLPVDDDSATVLSQVEAVGWRLDNAGYRHEVDPISSSNMQDQIQSASSSSRLIGLYHLL